MHLLEEESRGGSISSLLQSLNQFFLNRIPQEFKSVPSGSNIFERVSTRPDTFVEIIANYSGFFYARYNEYQVCLL